MPLLDLQQHLKQELLTNPFLELVEPEEEEAEEEEASGETSGETEPTPERKEAEPPARSTGRKSSWTVSMPAVRREEHEEREYYEPVTVATRDLSDHLRDQVAAARAQRRGRLARRRVHRQHQRRRLSRLLARRDSRGHQREVGRAAEAAEDFDGRAPALYDGRSRGDARASSRSSTRPASARVTCASACCCSCAKQDSNRRCSIGLVRDAFDELINHRWSEISKRFGISAARRAEGRRRNREARPQARPSLQRRQRQLHRSRPRRRQDRRRVSRLPQRREPAASRV